MTTVTVRAARRVELVPSFEVDAARLRGWAVGFLCGLFCGAMLVIAVWLRMP